MKKNLLFPMLFISLNLMCLHVNAAANQTSREIALTFDDAPTPDTRLFTGEERTQRIIKALKQQQVSDVLFYVKTDDINEKTAKRLTAYTQAGFHLANHSHTHQSINRLGVEAFIADAKTAQEKLKNFDNLLPYFRYPYLEYGNDPSVLKSAHEQLSQLGYSDGYITVKTADWYVSALFTETPQAEKQNCTKHAKDFYISHIEKSIAFYDALAQKTLNRSPKHVLLLHENDAAALYLGDLIAHLKQQGWRIISPQQAYKDPIAKNFYFLTANAQGRPAAIAVNQGADAKWIFSPDEITEKLKEDYSMFCNKFN